MEKQQVLLIANTAWYLYNFRRHLVQELLLQGFSVSVAAPQDHEWGERLKRLGARFHPITLHRKSVNPLAEIKAILSIRRLLIKLRPCSVFSFTPKINIYTGLVVDPLVLFVPNISGLGSSSKRLGLSMIVRSLYKVALSSADAIFVQNPHDVNSIRDLAAGKDVTWSPGSGVSLSEFKFNRKKITERRRKVVSACRLIREKGVIEYLNAIGKVRASGIDLEAYLAGIPDEGSNALPEDLIKRLAKENGVVYLGQVDNIAEVLSDAILAVLPSYYAEGIPRFLLEAAASGCVLLAARNPGSDAVVLKGRNGFSCLPGCSESLAEKLKEALTLEPYVLSEMAEESRKVAEEFFDVKVTTKMYLDRLKFIQYQGNAA